MRLDQRSQLVELILSDVDGVMTNGRVIFDNAGIETKTFHIRDGLGIRLWQQAGYDFGLVTSRNSHIVNIRASELGIGIVRQGVSEKLPAVRHIMSDLKLEPHQVCYIGDDLPDVRVMLAVGVGVAVADAPKEVRRAAHFTTSVSGGDGAIRETVEWILKNQHRWDDVVRKYLTE